MKQRLDELFALIKTQHKEIGELKNENELKEADIKRKNQDLLEEEEYKDAIENNIDALAAEIAKAREAKLIEQEYTRRTSNQNNLLKLKIE